MATNKLPSDDTIGYPLSNGRWFGTNSPIKYPILKSEYRVFYFLLTPKIRLTTYTICI
ncbi:hypothetical protein [Porphyromonas gingivicanis]|uniref:hypothetical protein n=1 Tax=Porphyromonas gingivicanis TaxID=266762 RepID=UPI00131EDB16|nr:hypothetical protein [Porphyromonas gingivicanis]